MVLRLYGFRARISSGKRKEKVNGALWTKPLWKPHHTALSEKCDLRAFLTRPSSSRHAPNQNIIVAPKCYIELLTKQLLLRCKNTSSRTGRC